MIETGRPDIVVVDKEKKDTMIIDVAVQEIQEYVTKNNKKSKLIKRRNCQIMANEKVHRDSHCSWNIRDYNKNV